jgi:hypothetical protein
MDGDRSNPEDPDGDGLSGQPTEWFDPMRNELADSPEADLGDGGLLQPWKTTDI